MIEKLLERKIVTISDAAKAKAQASAAMFVDRVVSYSQLWPSPPPMRDSLIRSFEASVVGRGETLYQQPSFCVYTASDSTACKDVYARTPVINTSIVLTYPTTVPNSSNGLIESSANDVLVLSSRLNLADSNDAAEQLYKAFTGEETSSQTTILVQTDSLSPAEFYHEVPEALQELVGRFVTKNAKALHGMWYVGDLKTATPTKSTYLTAPVSVSFAISPQEMLNVLKIDTSDPYEFELVYKPQRVNSCVDGCDDGNMKLYLTVGFVTVALISISAIWSYKRRSAARLQSRQNTPPEVLQSVSTMAPQPPPGWYAQAPSNPPEPIPPMQWVAEPVNGYSYSYTPADARRPNPVPY